MEQVNVGVTDDGHATPASFSVALEDGYLGNPSVVASLLATYCSFAQGTMERLQSGEIENDLFVSLLKDAGSKMAEIFSGKNPKYTPIIGWNSVSLPARLQVELKHYWTQHRDEYDGSPLRVFFAWLCWAVYDTMKRTDDPDLFGIIMSGHLSRAQNLLLGVDARN